MSHITTAISPKVILPDWSAWRAGFLIIACALTWLGLAPLAKADGIINRSSYRDVVLADNPTMYWRLGEMAGPLAYDESSNHRDASYVGNPTLGLRGAIAHDKNASMGSNGANQYAQWNPTLSIAGAFTVEAWVKEKKISRPQTFFSTRSKAADFSFDLKFGIVTIDSTQKQVHFDVGDGSRWLANSGIPFDYQPAIWYHVVAVVTPAGATYYVNGAAIGSASYSGSPLLLDAAHMVQIGTNTEANTITREVETVLDEVAVYDYALTGEQIAAHYFAAYPPGE